MWKTFFIATSGLQIYITIAFNSTINPLFTSSSLPQKFQLSWNITEVSFKKILQCLTIILSLCSWKFNTEKDLIHKSQIHTPGFPTSIIKNKGAVFSIGMEIIWGSTVGIYGVYGLGTLSGFVTSLEQKRKNLNLLKRIFYLDTYLVDNLIYFIGSPTCLSNTLQIGSCLAQGEGSDKHREEHLQEMDGTIMVSSG